MNVRPALNRSIALSLASILLLSACGGSGEEPTATMSAEQIQTQAVETFAAYITETAQAMPTETPAPTETPVPTATNTPAPTNTVAATTAPTSSCYGLTFVSDVTIPDNTNMTPGQKFTKTWRVRNSGSCAWDSGFKFNFTGGEAMGGSSVTLGSAVQPGKETELSISLTAPSTAGTYRGNWRMTTSTGTYFGDEVYVLIVVGDATATATSVATAVPSATTVPTEAPTEPTS
ncbi:MAG: NBR1-Ig-like domain-containing protein [Anaerolineales bacterium]